MVPSALIRPGIRSEVRTSPLPRRLIPASSTQAMKNDVMKIDPNPILVLEIAC
jgi:hypothetical protein